MKPFARRVVGLVIAIALGQFFYLRIHEGWLHYWLLTDAAEGKAKITANYWAGHGQVVYYYDVKQAHYSGVSGKNWRAQNYNDVGPGSETVVFYSASHPWLSSLCMPSSVVSGIPVLVVAFVIELFAMITIIKPESKWAFNLDEKKNAS
ncbi:MAG TPA: hypothetical protein VF988_17830 [Verrucomicrobiae bacterium]